ncbi:MAG TPA: FHA domain-containing protein [Kofleriaceae bacterium]|nr:FHA domain-containing protein [Kofleriaceae bacterium]
MDQSKKTMRHFYCRDVLWETFEQMANDFDCSIDYLINEAMRYYARSKNYQSAMATSGPLAPHQPAMGGQVGVPAPNAYAAPGGPVGGVPAAGYGAAAQGQQQQMPSPHVSRRSGAPPPPPMGGPVRRPTQSQPPRAASPGVYRDMGQMGVPGVAPAGAAATLYLVYNNQRYPITKDQFIIGRGSKTSDLPIKDGNISRKHAAVIRRNGTYYIKDLGSTNGIDYKGMRIDNKRIDEGDVFHLCDYELRFTYRTD